MYKRVPASYFDTFYDVYFVMIEFMEECGFSIITNDAKSMFSPDSNVKEAYLLQDPNTVHKLCLILYDKDVPELGLFIIDDYDSNKLLYEQVNHIPYKNIDDASSGIGLKDRDESTIRLEVCDLFCSYINRSLMFVYVPCSCYYYSHDFIPAKPIGGHMIFYGNFTKYHIGYDDDVVLTFGIVASSFFGKLDSNVPSVVISNHTPNTIAEWGIKTVGAVYCSPEASFTEASNKWFVWDAIADNDFKITSEFPNYAPIVFTSFDRFSSYNRFDVVNYGCLYNNLNLNDETVSRSKTRLSSTLNNSSVLMPLIVYGLREPKQLFNWSAIGESKLVNMVDMTFINSGEVFMNNGIEKDYHKYFVFPSMCEFIPFQCHHLGIAIEIWAKENLLKEKSSDKTIVVLTDTYRNFDRIVIEYKCANCGNIFTREFTYDEFNSIYSSSGIYNIGESGHTAFKLYCMGNADGNSNEYTFTFNFDGISLEDRHEIISIVGYRE